MFWLFLMVMFGMGFMDNRKYSTVTNNVTNNFKTSKIEIPKGLFGIIPNKGESVKNKVDEIKKENEKNSNEVLENAEKNSSVLDAK